MMMKSGGGAGSVVETRTVRVVVDSRNGAIARVYGGECVMPWETVHACALGDPVEAPHLIVGKPVTETELRR